MRPGSAVEPLTDLLARLELRHEFLAHVDLLAGARVAPNAGRAVFDRKGAEAAELHAIATGHRVADLIEDGVDDVLDVALKQMRILACKLFDQFGLDHLAPGKSGW